MRRRSSKWLTHRLRMSHKHKEFLKWKKHGGYEAWGGIGDGGSASIEVGAGVVREYAI